VPAAHLFEGEPPPPPGKLDTDVYVSQFRQQFRTVMFWVCEKVNRRERL